MTMSDGNVPSVFGVTAEFWIVQQPESIAVWNQADAEQRIAPNPECGKPGCGCVGMTFIGEVCTKGIGLYPLYECTNGERTAIEFVPTPKEKNDE